TEEIGAVAFSPDGRRLASTCWIDPQRTVLEQVKIWDMETGKEILTLGAGAGHRRVSAVAFSPDGRRVATGSEGAPNAVRVWDADTGRELQALTLDWNPAAVAYSPDGRRLAASSSATVRVWDAANGREVRTLPGGGTRLAFSPDGRRLATNGP